MANDSAAQAKALGPSPASVVINDGIHGPSKRVWSKRAFAEKARCRAMGIRTPRQTEKRAREIAAKLALQALKA